MFESVRSDKINVAPAVTEIDRKAEIDAHFQVTAFSVSAALSAACLIVLTIAWAGAMRGAITLQWLLFMLLAGAIHIAAAVVYRRRPNWRASWRPWAFATALITLAEGLGWGFAPFAVPIAGNGEAMFLAMTTTLCVSAGSVIGYGRYLPTRIIAFVAPTAPYLIYSALSDDRLVRGSFFLILVFVAALGRLGLTADLGFRREAAMRKHNAGLAEDLLLQKEAAEHANLAKSKFLAAASHDLRQPIHALGLYIGALRAASLTPQQQALVAKLEAALEAMDRLFAAILDISRLDAGVVEVRAETFALDQLLAPLCENFSEEALRKGLRLTFEPGGSYVRADRVLLERMLRNLLSNAVRYTDRGEIRVRSRRRGGRAAVQVWDTGRGIAKAHIPFIFEEYFQIGNPERDREKGLGLGLAIVRRLAALLDATVKARSRIGCGSCFEVRLPIGPQTAAVPAAASPTAIVGRESGLVVVVDDDAAVRDAMRVALTNWGYSVIVAESGRDAFDLLDAQSAEPALLLCDLRLRAGEDGITVVAQFRKRYGAALSALLITGDTAPERVAEAHASQIHLLHKPVIYGKLRAAVGHLAGLQAAP